MISGLVGSGQMSETEKMFEEMLERDFVSWTSMMSGYHNGQLENTVNMFYWMIRDGSCVDDPWRERWF
jgi:pentatricopeptide repeat protein